MLEELGKTLPSIKEQAEALRIGLQGGYVETRQIIEWADALIVAAEMPDSELIEVSLGSHLADDELARTLRSIKGDLDRAHLIETIFHQMAEVLRLHPNWDRRIAKALYLMYLENLVPMPYAEAEKKMSHFDDAFDLAEARIYGTLEHAHDELIKFLSRWAK